MQMKMGRWLIPVVAVFAVISYSRPVLAYENVCPYFGQARYTIAQTFHIGPESVPEMASSYCQNIGHDAYNALGTDRIRATYLGPIVGVTWINSGDVITQPETGPRVIHQSGFMYIIGPGGVANHIFYRWSPEVSSH